MASNPNDYDGAVSDYLGQKSADTGALVANNLENAQGTNPDQAAQTQQLAKVTRLPVPTVQAMPEVAKTAAAMQSFDGQTLAQRFPNTAAFLTVPDNMAISHDDIPGTANVEHNVKRLGNPNIPADASVFKPGPAPTYRERLTNWFRDLVGLPPAGRDDAAAARAFLDVTAKQLGTTREGLREAVGGMSPIPQQFAQGLFSGATAGLAPDEAGAPDTAGAMYARGAGDLLGFMGGLPMKAAGAAMKGVEVLAPKAGEAFIKALGKDVTRHAATLGIASAVGATGAALDTNTPGGAVAAYLHAAGAGALTGGAFGTAGRLFPDNTLAQFAARTVATSAALDAIQGTRPWDDRPLAQKVFDYGLNTIFSLNGAGRTGGGWLHDAARADAAAQDGAVLQGIATSATASKLRARDPERFKQFVADAAQDGPVQAVYVDGTQLADVLHQGGVGMEGLAETMPDVARQIPEALSTGGQVRIPVEDFATHIAGSPLQDALMPHLRTDPEGMTLAESEAFYQSNLEQLQAEARRLTEEKAAEEPYQTSRQQVYDRILEQLDQAGRFTPDVNRAYAALQRDFYTTMADRLGVPPHELLEQYPLKIQTEDVAAHPVLNQDPVASLTGEEIAPRGADLKTLRAQAKEWYADHLAGTTVHNPQLGDIQFNNRGLRKMLSSSANPDKLKLVSALPRIIADGELVRTFDNRDKNTHQNIVRYHWIRGNVLLDGKNLAVEVNVEEHKDGKLYYNHTLPGNEYFQESVQARNPSIPGVVSPAERSTGGEHQSEALGSEPPASSVSQNGDDLNIRILEQPARGSFDPATNTITLLQNADLSTFLHESGHFFLETLANLAAKPGAPEAVKADMQAVLKWLGVKDLADWQARTLEQKREAHEQFARGFEAYLFEGKSPSLEMAPLFERFRRWLLQIYRSLAALRVNLTPEVRGVFDRMLASDEAITQAEQARSMTALFRTPEEAQAHGVDYEAYQALGAQATEKAVGELTTRSLRDMAWLENTRNRALRALAKDAAQKRKDIRREVEAEVDQQPVYAAQKFLKRGETVDAEGNPIQALEGHRLNIDALKAMYPEGALEAPDWQKLGYGKYGMLGEKGLDPNIVADMFSFRNGDDLVRALLDAEPRRSVVQGMTEQLMLERHGEVATPDALARTADAMVHNDVRARFIATELKALNKAIGPARDLARAAQEVAQATIGRRRVRDITVGEFTAAESKAGRAAEKKLAAGDTTGAAVAKRNQLLNNQLARAARDALAEIDKGLKYLARFDKPSAREAIDLEYRDQIDALLDRYDLRRSVSGRALDKREALLAFVERMAADGYEPQVPEVLLDEARRLHYKDASFEEFKGLVDAVKSIEHLGKLKTRLLDGKAERELAALADEAAITTAKLPQRAPESNRGLNRMARKWMDAKAAGRSLGAALLKMEQMFDWLDARNPNGVFNRVVFRRISDAGVRENDLLARVKGEIDKLVAAHMDDVTRDGGKTYLAEGLIDSATGLPQRFTKKEMLMLAGNMGNESNAAKLIDGEKWTEAAVWDFLNKNLTKADWDFVAGIGRALESLWPEKLAMSRRLGNTNPEKIAPRPFDTPHGRYDGWYWPMIYDPARSQDVAERGAKSADALFENTYSRANTDTGRLNTRNANYARPLLLDLDAIPRVIRDEIHDIAFREAVIDADRFLRNGTVRKAIVDTLGQQHYDQLRPWLQSIANDGRSSTENMRALKWFNDLAHGARTRATMVGLGYRISTILVHGSSAAMESAAELGPRWFASGLADFANPRQWVANKNFVFERSGEMRNRMNEVDRDVRDHLREIDTRLMDPASSALRRGTDLMKAHAYQGIAMLDMASALPTWMGAYKKALSPVSKGGLGMSEENAVYFADKTVRNAHGGTGVKDLAAVQRGPEFFKLFTMFYTFWNHNVNRLMDTAKLVTSSEHRAAMKEANHWRDSDVAATVIMRTLIYTLGVQMMHGLFHPPKDDDEEGWLKWAGREITSAAFSGIPIARDIAAWALGSREYSVTPAASMVNAIGQSGTDAAHALMGEQVSDKWLKHAITTAGYVFALPTGQPASAIQFLWDVGDGAQDPQGAAEWWRGVMHGDIRKH